MNIRLAAETDAAAIREIYAPYCFTPISFESEPPSVEEIRQRLVKVLARFPWLIIEDGVGSILGYVYAGPHRERHAYQWSADVSVYIREGHQRRGLGRALYTSLFHLLVLQGFYNAYAGTTLPNPASVGLHQSLGFHEVGIYQGVGYKYGTWHDVAWWQLALQERSPNPAPPRERMQVEQLPEWDTCLASGLVLLKR